MSEQDWGLVKEWWANVYPHVDAHIRFGGKFSRRAECERFTGEHAAFRIHVRLKPEGAPARYADAEHRRKWEAHPGIMQMHDPLFSLANLPRKPKTEERASCSGN